MQVSLSRFVRIILDLLCKNPPIREELFLALVVPVSLIEMDIADGESGEDLRDAIRLLLASVLSRPVATQHIGQ